MWTDRVCDYVPVISTITNLVDLFEKCVLRFCCKPESPKLDNRYFSHIKDKSKLRCVILFVPFLGNIIIAVWDLLRFTFKCIKNCCGNSKDFYDKQIDDLNVLSKRFGDLEKCSQEEQNNFWVEQCKPTLEDCEEPTLGLADGWELPKAKSKTLKKERKVSKLAKDLIEMRRIKYREYIQNLDADALLIEARRCYTKYALSENSAPRKKMRFKENIEKMTPAELLSKFDEIVKEKKGSVAVLEIEEIASCLKDKIN